MREHLIELLAGHEPADSTEAAHQAAMVQLLEHARPCARSTEDPGHFTASAFVLSPDGESILLIHHAKLDLWLQPGGHIDATDGNLFEAACREVREETGMADVVVAPGFPVLLDLDVHEIPANPRKGEGAHRHFDVRVLLQALHTDAVAGSDALAVRWVALDEVAQADTDDSVLRAVAKLQRRRDRLRQAVPQHAPATLRNREPILERLRGIVRPGERVLELSSWTGEHARFFAPALDVAWWQPSDIDDDALATMTLQTEGVVRPPMRINATDHVWPLADADVIFSANMVHISPWSATLGLLDGAGRTLGQGGRLVLYGPYRVTGVHTSDSNARFDDSLRGRDPSWGVRDLEAVVAEAARRGLQWRQTHRMPANNLLVVFERVVS